MNSQDVFTITADEQSFRVYVVTALDAHNTRLTRLEDQQASMSGEIQEICGEIKDLRGEIKGLQGEVQEIRGELTEIRGGMKVMQGDIQEIRGEIKDLRGEMKEVRAEIKVVNDNQLTLAAKLDAMSYWGGIFIAGMAVLAAVIGIFMPLYMLKGSHKENPPAPVSAERSSVSDVREIVRQEVEIMFLRSQHKS